VNTWLHSILTTLQDTVIPTAIREDETLFPAVESIHVLAICTVIGTISIVDLRLLGLASRDRPVLELSRDVLWCTWIAFGIAAISGGLLFSSRAVDYSGNFFFQVKLVLLVLAGLNMASFHLLSGRKMGEWGVGVRPPFAARAAGGLSLLLWIGVVGFGRWIGFTLH
jgi:hypothetical protein